MPVYISPPPRNPISQLLGAIIGVALMIGAFMVGIVAVAVVAAVGLVVGIVAWFRTRKLRKHLREQMQPTPGSPNRPDHQSIDAEYTVISTEKDP